MIMKVRNSVSFTSMGSFLPWLTSSSYPLWCHTCMTQKRAEPFHITVVACDRHHGAALVLLEKNSCSILSSLDFLLVWFPWMGVCVCAVCLVWSMITLVFLQVLEPFCPLSEQENSDSEEVEVIQPASSATVLLPLQTELNPCSLSSDSLAPKDLSCDTVLTETSVTTVPFTAIAAASFSDTDAGLPPPAQLPNGPSDPQRCSRSASPDFNSPSESHSGAHSVEDDSTPPHPPSSSPFTDMITIHPSKTPADDSNCTPGIV